MYRNFCPLLLLLPLAAVAGEVEIINAEATRDAGGTYRFDVRLRHDDSGWEHYADGWEILAPDGTQLGKRTLYHPHVDEQPFTRSLGGVEVPPGVQQVLIQAHDSVHGTSPQKFPLNLPPASGGD